MAILDYEGLAWFDTSQPPSRSLLSVYGFAFSNASRRDVEVVKTASFTGPRLPPPSDDFRSNGIGIFRRLETIGANHCVAYLVPPDYVQERDFLGYCRAGTVGSLSDIRANGVGFKRNSAGEVTLSEKSGSAGSLYNDGAWTALPEGVWLTGSANTVYIVKSGTSYELYVNDFGPVVSVTSSAVIDGVGLCCYALEQQATYPFSMPITATQPGGPLSFRYYRPGVDGATDFVPDTGATGADRLREEMPDGDASYVEASENGASATYQYTDASGNPIEVQEQQTVHGVKHFLSAKVNGADTRYLVATATDGVSEAEIGVATIRGEYANQQIDMPVNPLTGVAWQPTDFDGLMLGFKIDDEAM